MAIVCEHLGQQTKIRSTSEATFQHPFDVILEFKLGLGDKIGVALISEVIITP